MAINAKRYVVVVKVLSVNGKCARGHYPGQEWRIELTTPAGICMGAFGSIFPAIRGMQFGATFPWQRELNAVERVCPDPYNPVVFRIERIIEETLSTD